MKKSLFILITIFFLYTAMGFWGEMVFGQEINTLDKIFNNTKSLSLDDYTIEKIPGPQDEQWSAVLKKNNEVIMRFENGYLEDMTIFGLYPFIVNR